MREVQDMAYGAAIDRQPRAALGLADGLGLAAAPTFAAMAVLTTILGGGDMAMICGAAPTPLSGMVPMYVLMTAFHSAPWLRLIARRLPSPRSHEAARRLLQCDGAINASITSEKQLKDQLQDQAWL